MSESAASLLVVDHDQQEQLMLPDMSGHPMIIDAIKMHHGVFPYHFEPDVLTQKSLTKYLTTPQFLQRANLKSLVHSAPLLDESMHDMEQLSFDITRPRSDAVAPALVIRGNGVRVKVAKKRGGYATRDTKQQSALVYGVVSADEVAHDIKQNTFFHGKYEGENFQHLGNIVHAMIGEAHKRNLISEFFTEVGDTPATRRKELDVAKLEAYMKSLEWVSEKRMRNAGKYTTYLREILLGERERFEVLLLMPFARYIQRSRDVPWRYIDRVETSLGCSMYEKNAFVLDAFHPTQRVVIQSVIDQARIQMQLSDSGDVTEIIEHIEISDLKYCVSKELQREHPLGKLIPQETVQSYLKGYTLQLALEWLTFASQFEELKKVTKMTGEWKALAPTHEKSLFGLRCQQDTVYLALDEGRTIFDYTPLLSIYELTSGRRFRMGIIDPAEFHTCLQQVLFFSRAALYGNFIPHETFETEVGQGNLFQVPLTAKSTHELEEVEVFGDKYTPEACYKLAQLALLKLQDMVVWDDITSFGVRMFERQMRKHTSRQKGK